MRKTLKKKINTHKNPQKTQKTQKNKEVTKMDILEYKTYYNSVCSK